MGEMPLVLFGVLQAVVFFKILSELSQDALCSYRPEVKCIIILGLPTFKAVLVSLVSL